MNITNVYYKDKNTTFSRAIRECYNSFLTKDVIKNNKVKPIAIVIHTHDALDFVAESKSSIVDILEELELILESNMLKNHVGIRGEIE